MATFYVTQSGTGNGDTYLTAMSVAAHNANTYGINPGNTVYLCDLITSRVIPPISGTPGNIITYKGDYVDHASDLNIADGGNGQIVFTGKSYLTFQSLTLRNGSYGLTSTGGSNYIIIKKCTIHDNDTKGIHFHNGGSGENSYVTIGGADGDGNTIYNISTTTAGTDVMLSHVSQFIVSYNTLYGTGALGVDGIAHEYSQYGIIEYNKIYDHPREDGIDFKNNSHHIIVRFNNIYGHPNQSGITVQLGSYNIYIYGNSVQGSGVYGGILVHRGNWSAHDVENVYIWSNLVYDTDVAGIHISSSGDSDSSISNIKIYNNVIASNGRDPETYSNAGVDVRFGSAIVIKNNVFFGNTGTSGREYAQVYVASGLTAGVTFQYNQGYYAGQTAKVYWGSSGLLDFDSATAGSNNIIGDPGFTDEPGNDYTLTGSVKDTGTDLSGLAGSFNIQGITYNMYYDDCLDPDNTNFSTTPPTVATIDQDTYGNWEKGAYVYTTAGPNGVINTPSSNQQIYEGEFVNFTGTASDGTPPYTYLWDFNGGATNSTNEDPGNITFNIAGVYTIQFIVTDDEDVTDSTPDTVEITVYGTGNNFSGDSNCVAVWRFEDSPGFGIDSQGSNDLTNVGADEENTYYKEGSQSASFNRAISDRMTITDANQDAGFPWRYDDGESIVKDFSICGWFRLKTVPSDYSSSYYIFSKYSLSSARVFGIWISDTDNNIRLAMGWNNGETYEEAPFGTACVINRWYHFGITYDSATKFGRIRMWDDTAQALLDSDKTNTYANATDACDVGLTIGTRDDAGRPFDGYIDELVVFNRVITIDEIDDIRNQIYSTGWSYTINGITSFSKINGILISNIKYINSV